MCQMTQPTLSKHWFAASQTSALQNSHHHLQGIMATTTNVHLIITGHLQATTHLSDFVPPVNDCSVYFVPEQLLCWCKMFFFCYSRSSYLEQSTNWC